MAWRKREDKERFVKDFSEELKKKSDFILAEYRGLTAAEMTEVRKGEQYFNDATLCFQKWQSCASCHPDARADGLRRSAHRPMLKAVVLELVKEQLPDSALSNEP